MTSQEPHRDHHDTPLIGHESAPSGHGPHRPTLPLLVIVAVLVTGSAVVLWDAPPKPPERVTTTYPTISTTVPVLGEAEPFETVPTLTWARARGLEDLDGMRSAVEHRDRIYLATDDGARSRLHVSDDGLAWEPLPTPDGNDQRDVDVARLASIGRHLVAVGTTTDEDGDAEVTAWWRTERAEWSSVPLPSVETTGVVPPNVASHLRVTGAATVDERLLVSASEHLTNRVPTIADTDLPERWRTLQEAGLAFVGVRSGQATLWVEPYPVAHMELEGPTGTSTTPYSRTQTLLWTVTGPDAQAPSPNTEPAIRVEGTLPNDSVYGIGSAGRLAISDDGRDWVHVGRASDVNAGNDTVPFAEGWMRIAGNAISYSPTAEDWAFASPRTLTEGDGGVVSLTSGRLGVVALARTFDEAGSQPTSVAISTTSGPTVIYDVPTATTTVRSADGILLEFDQMGPDSDQDVPVTVDGEQLVFTHPDTGDRVAWLPVRQWVDVWSRAFRVFPKTSVIHSTDGIAWSIQPVPQITGGFTSGATSIIQAADVVLLVAGGPDPEMWVGRPEDGP